MLLCVPETL